MATASATRPSRSAVRFQRATLLDLTLRNGDGDLNLWLSDCSVCGKSVTSSYFNVKNGYRCFDQRRHMNHMSSKHANITKTQEYIIYIYMYTWVTHTFCHQHNQVGDAIRLDTAGEILFMEDTTILTATSEEISSPMMEQWKNPAICRLFSRGDSS